MGNKNDEAIIKKKGAIADDAKGGKYEDHIPQPTSPRLPKGIRIHDKDKETWGMGRK